MSRGAMPAPILQVHGLSFAFPDAPPLVDGWDAQIGAGVTQLFGDTGSGKSTLLRLIAGALPAAGRLTLAGVRLDQDRAAYQRQLFLCDPAIEDDDQMTAREVAASRSGGVLEAAAWRELVDGFALAAHLDKPMFMLSTGTRRKLALAAALACERALILLDEPTAGLDGASIRCLWNAVARVSQRGRQAVLVASAERIERVALAQTIELPPR